MAVVAHGARVGVRVNTADALPRVVATLPSGTRTARQPIVDSLFSLIVTAPPNGNSARMAALKRYSLLYSDTQLLVRDLSVEPVFDALSSSLHLQIAHHARRRLFVRSAVVAWRDRAILIVGRAGAGRTRLVKALCTAGSRCYSDMFAVLDSAGRVHAYETARRELPNVDDGDAHATPFAMSGSALPATLPVALIIDAHYRPGARWRPRTLSPGQAALALLDHVVPGRAGAAFALRTLSCVAQGAAMVRGRRGEATDMIPSILEQMNT